MNYVTADSEGVGLNGPSVSWQWALDEGKVHVHYPWEFPVRDTLRLFDKFCETDFINLWNATFDWFQLQRMHNIFRLLPLARPPTLAGWLRVEDEATDGPCVKPNSCFDGLLHARKGPWQSLMSRDDIRIRRVPRVLAQMLCSHLTSTTDLDSIYFSRREKGMVWEVDDNSEDEDFPDVILRFGASAGLKPLSQHTGVARKVLGHDVHTMDEFIGDLYDDMTKDTWDPFVHDWVPKFNRTRKFWLEDSRAKKYMVDDVVLTRAMRHHFKDPPHGDNDSVLACQVASARWRGYGVHRDRTQALLDSSEKDMTKAPRAWREVLAGLHKRMEPAERIAVTNTRSETLEEIAGTRDERTGKWVGGWEGPAKNYARKVIVARSGERIADYCRKLLKNQRGHPDFRIIATLSNRMGGTGGLNWQAFSDAVKKCLRMADGSLSEFDSGDFWAFEVTLAAAVYNDQGLIEALKSGKKIHALFGSSIFGIAYEEIYDQESEKAILDDIYDKSKRGFFAKTFGAQAPKLALTLFGSKDPASLAKVEAGSAEFERRFPGVAVARKRIEDAFCSMRQPGGIGSQVEWHEPAEYIDSLFGFRRWYTLENKICRSLFNLAQRMPGEFRKIKHIKVSRRAGRIQTPGGACQSAIFAAAFNIQARAQRSAANHEIQASGAAWTKEVQREIWDLQPAGVHPWVVQPLNEHDSIPCPRIPTAREAVKDAVSRAVTRRLDKVPLGRLDWKQNLEAWK